LIANRQWFKASKGLEISQTHREVALCDHTIREPDTLMELPDATLDPRFRENPLVTGEPWIRFYAGMPLVTPNHLERDFSALEPGSTPFPRTVELRHF
jgi:GAF domain-containing protein